MRKIPIGTCAEVGAVEAGERERRRRVGRARRRDARCGPGRPSARGTTSSDPRSSRGRRRCRPAATSSPSARCRIRAARLGAVLEDVEDAVVEDRAVLVDLDERRARGARRPHAAPSVRCLRSESMVRATKRRLGAERERHRVEGCVERAERRRLGDLADLRGGGVLALGQAVDLVVEQQDLEVDVAAQRVDQVVAADRQRVAVTGDDPDRQVLARRRAGPSRWPARGRGSSACRRCRGSRGTASEQPMPETKTMFSRLSPSSGRKPCTAARIA